MAGPGDKPLGENTLPQNVHVSSLHLITRTLFSLFSTTIAIWLIAAVVIPMFAGVLKKGQDYVDYLRSVTAHERTLAYGQRAAYTDPRMSDAERQAAAIGQTDHVKEAERIADKIIPPHLVAKRGTIVSVDDPSRNEQTMNQAGKDSGGVVKTIGEKANSYIDDTFYPVFREMIVVFLARMGQVFTITALFAPLVIGAWFAGEAVSRANLKRGQVPKAARYVFFKSLLMFFPATILSIPALPVPLNVILVIPVLCSFLVFLAYMVRSNFVEL